MSQDAKHVGSDKIAFSMGHRRGEEKRVSGEKHKETNLWASV